MTNKFCNKFKKTCFWPIFGRFSQFWGQKIIFGKSGSVTHSFTWISSTISKFRKIMIQSQENVRTDGRMEGWTEGWADPISQDSSGYHRPKTEHHNDAFKEKHKRDILGPFWGLSQFTRIFYRSLYLVLLIKVLFAICK